MKSALDLQTETLDLAELAEACLAAGFPKARAFLPEEAVNGLLPSYRCFVWQPMFTPDALAAEFEHFLRVAARRVAPGSYCIPVPKHNVDFCGPFRVSLRNAWGLFPNDADSDDPRWRQMPRGFYGLTETECWARALVALHRAGLLGSVAN